MKLLGIILCLSLTGCTLPWTTWELKHDAKIANADAATLKAATDKLQASFQTQMLASDAVIANLQDEAANGGKLRTAQTTYDRSAYQVDTDPNIGDAAKVQAIGVLLTYSLKNGVQITDAEFAFMLPIIQGLEAQDAAHQQAAKAALDAKQVALDAVKASNALELQANGVLGAAKAKADDQVKTLSQKVDDAKAAITKAVGNANAFLSKYSVLKSSLITALWTVGIIIGIGALLAIGAIVYPPLYPISLLYRKIVGGIWKLIFLPVHWIYDIVESDLKKTTAPAATTTTPVTKAT